MFGCALLTPQTSWLLVVPLLFLSGLARSMQFTTLNTLAFADVPQPHMTGANTLVSMMNQMGNAIGIAFGALALRLGASLQPVAEFGATRDFQVAFGLVALLAVSAYLDFIRLSPDAADALRKRATSSG
jgi:fucose permease